MGPMLLAAIIAQSCLATFHRLCRSGRVPGCRGWILLHGELRWVAQGAAARAQPTVAHVGRVQRYLCSVYTRALTQAAEQPAYSDDGPIHEYLRRVYIRAGERKCEASDARRPFRPDTDQSKDSDADRQGRSVLLRPASLTAAV